MTIDLDRLETNPTWLGNNLSIPFLVELLRLARLGQAVERRKCGTCLQNTGLVDVVCHQRHAPRGQDWYCADWEEKT